MIAPTLSKPTGRLAFAQAAAIVLLLWPVYTLLEALDQLRILDEGAASLLECLPGLVGIAALVVAGLSRQDCGLRWASASRKGLVALGLLTLVLFTFPLSGRRVGWNPLSALVFAPSGALSQELYFRAALLPALTRLLPGRPRLALVVHSALFALWHVGPPVRGSPLAAIIMVMLVPFIAGLVWGWQARSDRTICWVLASHALVLSFWSLFTWG